MLILTGTILVIFTWLCAAAVIISLGLLLSCVTARSSARAEVLRGAMWWGLLVAIVFSYIDNLAFPLRSGPTVIALLIVTMVLGVPGWWLWRRRPSERTTALLPWPMLVGAALIAIALAVAVLGPVTNYDSGLYHLGAVHYAADYATIPGLANVYFPFGYGNAEFPLAALLEVSPWGDQGFRLLNGLLIVLGLVDLVVRSRTRGKTAGYFVTLVGLTVVAITMTPLADYWVTSPTQDSAVFLVTAMASGYLADLVTTRRWTAPAGVLAALCITLVLLRPTMVVFAGVAALCALLVGWRRRSATSRRDITPMASVVAVAVAVAAVAATIRDYVLSGWLQFPLSLHAFSVPWLAPDPTDARTATLGAARNPADLWNAAHGWNWVGAWAAQLPHLWETWAFLLLALAASAGLILASRMATVRWRGLLLAMAPSVVAVVFWWAFTPPSFRFAWGPVFTVATIPIGWAIWRLDRVDRLRARRTAEWASTLVMCLIAVIALSIRIDYSSITQEHSWGPSWIHYSVAPLRVVAVKDSMNSQGLAVRTPLHGDQCWSVFPVCTPQPPTTLRLRGDGIQQGFLP